jgi:hypothetical protein
MTIPTPQIVDGMFVTPRPCGPCSLCCKLLPVAELAKPAGQWCAQFDKAVGCSTHATRPYQCRDFQCLWTFAAPLDDSWRPDRCGFLMRPGPTGVEVVIEVDPANPAAWKREPFYGQIKAWSTRRAPPFRSILVRDAGRLAVVFPEGEIDLGPERPNEAIESGYVWRGGRQQPYAHYGPPGSPPAPEPPPSNKPA